MLLEAHVLGQCLATDSCPLVNRLHCHAAGLQHQRHFCGAVGEAVPARP